MSLGHVFIIKYVWQGQYFKMHIPTVNTETLK